MDFLSQMTLHAKTDWSVNNNKNNNNDTIDKQQQ